MQHCIPMSKNRKQLEAEVGVFIQQYARRRHAGHDPNDRNYDRGIERRLRQMDPEELDRMINGEEVGDGRQ